MPDLILRPSGRTEGKKWALQLRYHDCLGPAQYETICLVDREMADEIVAAGKPYWLFGEPERQSGEAEIAVAASAAYT